MTNKVFSSYYSGKNKDAENQQLIVEISSKHIACLIKNTKKDTVKNFELFKISGNDADFDKAYSDALVESSILNNQYTDTRLFINNDTSLFVPDDGYKKEAEGDYLNLVFGESANHEVRSDDAASMKNIYRVADHWMSTVNKSLVGVTVNHTYAKVVEQTSQKALNYQGEFLKVLFYEQEIIVVLVFNKKLHFIQTFSYQSREDILYYILSILQRFNVKPDNANLMLSGMIDLKLSLFEEIKKIFKKIIIEDADTNLAQVNFGDFPRHYFSPFFNLAR